MQTITKSLKTRATISDIAKKLKITPATVSRALSDHPEISEKTKKLVQQAAEELNYHRNKVASSLRLGKTYLIGVMIPSAAHNFFGQVIHGITNLANENGYDVLIYQSNEKYQNEVKGIQAFLDARVDGILASIANETKDYTHFMHVQKQQIPIAFFDRIQDNLGIPSVSINDYKGAFMATEHLIRQGYQRIAYVTGKQHHKIFSDRLNGYLSALQAYGIAFQPEYLYPGDIFIEAGKAAVAYFLQLPEPPDAIFSVEDYSALGVLKALKENGIRVPEDIALFGFCNDLFGEHITPSLSTMDQQTVLMGQEAFQMIYQMIEKRGEAGLRPRNIVLEPLPVIRQSSLKIR